MRGQGSETRFDPKWVQKGSQNGTPFLTPFERYRPIHGGESVGYRMVPPRGGPKRGPKMGPYFGPSQKRVKKPDTVLGGPDPV